MIKYNLAGNGYDPYHTAIVHPEPSPPFSDPSTPSPVPLAYDGRPETRSFWTGHLPHWEVLGRPIFLTLHVRGAIPSEAAARIRQNAADIRKTNDTDFTRRLKRIFSEMEKWLDRIDGGIPPLSQPKAAAVLRDAIAERHARNAWRVLHWVIMPSHLHLLYVAGTVGMKTLLADFKRWTGHRMAKAIETDGGRFWQDEWFDHWSRSADETDRIVSYIRQNPVRAGLVKRPEDWPYASWSQ